MMTALADRRDSTCRPADTATGALTRHRLETEQAIGRIKLNTTLSDAERGRRVTELLAEANARALALWSR